MKRCGCGREHDAAAWSALPLVGRQDDGVERIEIRNCACGSSIAIVLGPSALLLAQVACVALTDSENVGGPRDITWPPPPPLSDADRKEAERLRILAARLFYKAREAGQVDMSGDALWGIYNRGEMR